MEPHFELDQGANVEGQGARGFWIEIVANGFDSRFHFFELANADLDQSGNQQRQ
jgi:hypothetical protein